MKGVYWLGLKFKSQKEMAEYFGVSQNYISAVMTKKKSPSKKMLDIAGYEKVVIKTTRYDKKVSE